MTSKTELKELIVSLKEDIRELRMEVEMLKTLATQKNDYITPFVSDSVPEVTWKQYEGSGTVPYVVDPNYTNPKCTQVTTGTAKGYPDGTIINTTEGNC